VEIVRMRRLESLRWSLLKHPPILRRIQARDMSEDEEDQGKNKKTKRFHV
jgi:hypothetical protein